MKNHLRLKGSPGGACGSRSGRNYNTLDPKSFKKCRMQFPDEVCQNCCSEFDKIVDRIKAKKNKQVQA